MIKPRCRGEMVRFNPEVSISLTKFGSAAHVVPFVEPPGGAGSIAGLPHRNQAALGLSWLFLQPNNSQCSNCQIRNTSVSRHSDDSIPSLTVLRGLDPRIQCAEHARQLGGKCCGK